MRFVEILKLALKLRFLEFDLSDREKTRESLLTLTETIQTIAAETETTLDDRILVFCNRVFDSPEIFDFFADLVVAVLQKNKLNSNSELVSE